MPRRSHLISRPLSLALLAFGVACQRPDATDPTGLAHEYDVRQRVATDSGGTPLPPPPPDEEGPGFWRGVVRSNFGTMGPDTLLTSARLAGVIVRAIPMNGATGPVSPGTGPVGPATIPPGMGPIAAVDTTDAQGMFHLPTLPGGRYIVTFEPSNDDHEWAWVYAVASPSSGNLPWWVTLNRR